MVNRVTGTGLGFRRELIPQLRDELRLNNSLAVDFFEIAPENWMGLGGRFARDLREFSERFPFVCHGLSLSIGSAEPLDKNLLNNIRNFIQQHNIAFYTEHLSWCSDDGHLYDLLPIPCTTEAVTWVVDRIKQAQDILQMQIGFENASYYLAPPGAEMKEEEFICEVVEKSGCFLHLDVNNIYVNSQNFQFDPIKYLQALPLQHAKYIHVAGHYVEDDGTIVDTHGAEVIDPVWDLLEKAYGLLDAPAAEIPTCLERDFNIPKLQSLMQELDKIRQYQQSDIRSVSRHNAFNSVRDAANGR
ncbi:hypothetical protein TDB9533_04306 [Thalassocella blandensis]|nr:hypothetical protein TDB9533_04306 [Thalassocella blandensis]